MLIENPRGFTIQTRYVSPNKGRQRPWIKKQVWLVHHAGNGVDRCTLPGVVSWFMNPHSEVSSDFVIDRDGTIVRMAPQGCYAWHAGVCEWAGAPYRLYNHLSYGIELINDGNGTDPYPDVQLQALAYVCAVTQQETPTVKYPRRHADVAYPAGRKVDPRGLDLARIYLTLRTYQPDLEVL